MKDKLILGFEGARPGADARALIAQLKRALEQAEENAEQLGTLRVITNRLPEDQEPTANVEYLEDEIRITLGIPDGATGAPGRDFTYADFTPEQLAALVGPAGYTPQKDVDYFDGADGFSPKVDVQAINGGHRVSITDKDSTEVFDVMDGKDGAPGRAGNDGQPGQDGQDGQDGFSPSVTLEKGEDGSVVITVTNKDGSESETIAAGGTSKTPRLWLLDSNEENTYDVVLMSRLIGAETATVENVLLGDLVILTQDGAVRRVSLIDTENYGVPVVGMGSVVAYLPTGMGGAGRIWQYEGKGENGIALESVMLSALKGEVTATAETVATGDWIFCTGDGAICRVYEVQNTRASVGPVMAKIPDDDGTEAVAAHNVDKTAHPYIQELIQDLQKKVNDFLDVDVETADQLSELIELIEGNANLIGAITTGKVSVSDIADNLTTDNAKKVLSAAQGVVLKGLIDGKLEASKLQEAINTALAQAKASGEFDGEPGTPGVPGDPGKDGVSPTVSIQAITGGHRVSVTDKNGTKTFDVMDGEAGAPGEPGQPGQAGAPGQDGAPGEDGFSPTVSVTAITGGHRVSVTDKNGTKTFDVMDGTAGEDGGTAIVRVRSSKYNQATGWDMVCDGTDDQVEIQAAIDSLPEDGGIVELSGNKFYINSSISITKRNVTLRGTGTLIKTDSFTGTASNNPIITVSSSGTGAKIQGLTFDGAQDVLNDRTDIDIGSMNCLLMLASQTEVERCTLQNGALGAYVFSNSVNFVDCEIRENAAGIYATVAGSVKGSYFYKNQLALDMRGAEIVRDCIFRDNDIGIKASGTPYGNDERRIVDNVIFRGKGLPSDYTEDQHTIFLYASTGMLVVANNALLGKGVTDNSTTGTNVIESNGEESFETDETLTMENGVLGVNMDAVIAALPTYAGEAEDV